MDFDMGTALHDLVFGDNVDISDDEMLLIDFTDVDFDTSGSFDSPDRSDESSGISSSESFGSGSEFSAMNHTIIVAKSSAPKRGSKFMKKGATPKPAKKFTPKLIQEETVPRKAPLYVFPSFDKCDSLVFLPTTLTRHLNTGDIPAVRKLLLKHLDRECNISIFHCFDNMSLKLLLSMYQLMDEMQPDRIMCVSSTRVVGNQIIAQAHMKFTDSKMIHDAAIQNVSDPVLKPFLNKECREDGFKLKIINEKRPPEEEAHMIAMVDSKQDLTVYVSMDFVLTFSEQTKKITKFWCEGKVTSLQLKGRDDDSLSCGSQE